MVFMNTGLIGTLFSCFFCCPNAGDGFEDTYFMQKGREENECKEQKGCSKNNGAIKTETASKYKLQQNEREV